MFLRYDYTRCYEYNFQRWWYCKKANTKYGLPFTEEVARKLFDNHHGSKKVKIKRIKKY